MKIVCEYAGGGEFGLLFLINCVRFCVLATCMLPIVGGAILRMESSIKYCSL